MDVKYSYENFEMLLSRISNNHYELTIDCEIDDIIYSRVYKIFDPLSSIDMNGDYVTLQHSNDSCFHQLKFEYGSCIVIDEFDNSGEHISSIGCHDFNDDIDEEDDFTKAECPICEGEEHVVHLDEYGKCLTCKAEEDEEI